jgi:hypothetical protein
LWWDGAGRVWQRWNDDSVSGDWEPELTRYVYDGSQLGQEHHWTVIDDGGTWAYSYAYIMRDYLREPAGVRQRESSDGQNFTDRYLFTDGGIVAARADRSSSTTITRTMRLASGDRLPDTALGVGTSDNWSNISHLASPTSIIRDFGGGTSDEMKGFDALQQVGDRHYLTGLGRWVTLKGNNSQSVGTGSSSISGSGCGEDDNIPTMPAKREHDLGKGKASTGGSPAPSGCPDCCWDFYEKGCLSEFGGSPTRQCWHHWCCDCAYWSYVGFYPCNDASINCKERCCTDAIYESLPQGQLPSTSTWGKQCGGSGGSCWHHYYHYMHSSDLWWKHTVAYSIEQMCQNINIYRCLGICSSP